MEQGAVPETGAAAHAVAMPLWARRVLKWYGLLAPLVVFRAVGPLSMAIAAGAGYWLGVWWIVKTQTGSEPFEAWKTWAYFLALHAAMCGAVFVVFR